jgi:Neurotransmitter-gated ion-channel ligand binding domain
VILFCLVAFVFLRGVAGADGWSPPPGSRPVEVAVGIFLANLSGVAERSETFNADLYLSVRWRDARLAFAGPEPKRFLEDAAVDQLKEMWWPQLEFVNTAVPEVTNRALDISPDGSVRYELGVTGEFRADLDLRRFPFDRQTLVVRIQSFIWTDDQMVFVPDPTRIGFNPESTFEGLSVTRVTTEVVRRKLTGWTAAESYSELTAVIDVERRAVFFVWTVFTPVVLIFLISCTIFIVPFKDFASRIGISLTALLACIATQFAMSFNLPQIAYLTVIDWAFVITYACIALGVLVSTLQATLLHEQPERAERIDRLAGLGLPVLFLLLIALSVMW